VEDKPPDENGVETRPWVISALRVALKAPAQSVDWVKMIVVKLIDTTRLPRTVNPTLEIVPVDSGALQEPSYRPRSCRLAVWFEVKVTPVEAGA
jgi:hypothetical protein